MDKLERCIAQIGKNGGVVGAGFLIDPDHVMTCAHVINQCLGRENETPDRPTENDIVDVRFPWATGEAVYKGHIVKWFPLPLERRADDARVDIAVLQLSPSAPEAVRPARLQSFPSLDGKEVRTSGFPRGFKQGRPAQGVIRGADGGGWLFAQSRPDDLPFLGGHSGGPLLLKGSGSVVGMVSMFDDHKRDVGIFIPVAALEQAWPQLTVLPGRPRLNMAPPPPPDFVQRSHEFGALKEKLLGAKGDNVAITAALRGAGGYGKTTLAKALAHDPDIEAAYPDGILWVELGEKPANLLSIVVDVIEILNGERPGLENLTAAAAKLGEALADQRRLLIIDDAWREQDLRPFLQGGHNTTRLITTRRDDILPLKAERQKVDAMAADEALALLSWGLPKDQAAAEEPALAALTQRLGEWALLLKLVNGFLRDRVVTDNEPLSLAIMGVNKRLDLKGLSAFDARNEADRANAVAKTIGVSLELLNESERARFAELAVFPEDVDVPLGVVSRFWSETGKLDEIDSEDLLRRLQSLSLLLSLDRRTFRFHDTVRRFLQEQAGKDALATLYTHLLKALDGIDTDAGADEASRRYYFLHRPAHLAEAGERAALDVLLLDPKWLQAKLNALGSPQALIADYEQLGRGEAQNLIGRALRLTSGICARDKRQLLPQLHGRLLAQSAASAFCAEARRLAVAPAIVTCHPSLTPPVAEMARLEGHVSYVTALAALPDGRLASGSHDRTIRLWDAQTGQELARLEGHAGSVNALAALPGGRLASASEDDTIRLWDAQTGQELARLEGHAGWLGALAALPHGHLASASGDYAIRLWDAQTGKELARLEGHAGYVRALVALPDGRLASGSEDTTIRLWDAQTGQELARLEGHAGYVRTLAALPDGRLASGSEDTTIRLWDAQTGRELARLEGHAGWVMALAALPDGRLASGSYDPTIRLWDATTAKELARLEGHANSVYALAALPDGRLASGSEDDTIRLWDAQTGQGLARLEGHAGQVTALAALPGSRLASASADGTIRLWDAKTGRELARLEGHADWLTALAALPEGRLGSDSFDNAIRLRDAQSGRWVTALAALPDGRLASDSFDNAIRLWDAKTGRELARLEGHAGSVRALAALPDGRLASASEDGTIRLWDAQTGQELARIEGHGDWVTLLAALPEGRLASGSADSIRLWDARTGQELAKFEGQARTVTALPDGRLASGYYDPTIRLWDAQTGQELARIEVDYAVSCLVILDRKQLAAGDAGGRIHWLEILD
jgi:WD40 repeat protein